MHNKYRRSRFFVQFIIWSILCLALIARCGNAPSRGSSSAARNVAPREILIGEFGSLTGPQATFGQSAHDAILMAVNEINRNGGVAGARLRVITEDDRSKAEEAANAVTKRLRGEQ